MHDSGLNMEQFVNEKNNDEPKPQKREEVEEQKQMSKDEVDFEHKKCLKAIDLATSKLKT